jgi:catechol 2,3-dioxygenase-like lactoylglutathione lyase family enzyme
MFRALHVLCLGLLATPLLAQQTRPAITGIAFFRDYTTHPEEAQKFYGPTMGFAQKDAGDMWVYPVNESQWVEVIHGVQPPNPNGRMAAMGLTTRDVRGMEKYLNAKGIPTAEPMHDGEFAVKDPEGTMVYFVQSPYAAAHGAKLEGVALEVSHTHPLPSATSVRIIHVGFVVNDRAKEDAFWRDILGFKPYWHGWGKDPAAHGDDYVSMQVPDGTDWIEYMLNNHNPDLRQVGVMDHFSLGTPRMQDVLARLQANGCTEKMCTSIQAGRDGKIQLNLFDPDFTRIEYMEFTPAMKPCCSPFTGTQPGTKESE